MGINDTDIRKSIRIRDRAHRILNNNVGLSPAAHIPYHRRICTFGALRNVSAHIFEDISSPRSISNTEIQMAEENRISSIETDVGALKDDVFDIHSKLDKLLQAMTLRDSTPLAPGHQPPAAPGNVPNAPAPGQSPPSGTDPTHPSTQNTHGANMHQPAPQTNTPSTTHQPMATRGPRMPDAIERQLSLDGFIDRELDRDRFHYSNAGKNNFISDPHTSRVISKPYMFMYREGAHLIKQKLDQRQSMTAVEYIDATLALLADPRAYHKDDYADIMFHLRRVSRDALERPWHAVIKWSQYIWDMVESGYISWADRDIIQEERVRICLTCPTPRQSSASSTQPNSAQSNRLSSARHETLCRPFNSRAGCSHRDSHHEGDIYLLHQCSYCDSVGKQCGHSVRECERRLAHARPHDNQHQYRRLYHQNPTSYNSNHGVAPQSNSAFQPQYAHNTYNQQGFSKNGM